MLNFKKYLTLSLITLAPLGAFAQISGFTSGVPEGSFRGKFRGQESGRVHFIAKPINGCDGCFMATIFKRHVHPFFGTPERQIKTYKALPLNIIGSDSGKPSASEYSLTPIDVDVDGELTTPNDNPSMRLTITSGVATDDVNFSLSSAGSNNADPFASAMEFKGKASPFEVEEGGSGEYKIQGTHKNAGTIGMFSVSAEDQVTRFATITAYGSRHDSSGTFQVEEKAPGVFTYTSLGLFSYGEELAAFPKHLIVFIGKGSSEHAFVINPANSSDVSEIKIDHD